MISAEVNTKSELVEVCKDAYTSMVAPDGSFPGAELVGLVALRQAWSVWKQMRKHTGRSHEQERQNPAWQAMASYSRAEKSKIS